MHTLSTGSHNNCKVNQLSVTQDGEEDEEQTTIGSSLNQHQEHDPELKDVIPYPLNKELPADDKKTQNIVLRKGEFEMIDGILYHIEPDKTLKIVLPLTYQKIF